MLAAVLSGEKDHPKKYFSSLYHASKLSQLWVLLRPCLFWAKI